MESINTKIKHILFFCIFMLIPTLSMNSQEIKNVIPNTSDGSNDIKISLVTCSPGQLIYELFGHSAIRIEDTQRHLDLVFNYGVFNFNTDNFVYRFVKGETDYQLGIVEWRYFIQEYEMRGSSVNIQEINLTAEEKIEVVNYLRNNYQPINRIYRYNYFYDNCTTRARDVIEQCIDGHVVYIPVNNCLTFRDIVHQFTEGHPWSELGIDFCLGAEADTPIAQRIQMFIPSYTEKMFTSALIKDVDGNNRPLIAESSQALPVVHQNSAEKIPLTPMMVFWGLLVFSIIILILEYRLNRIFWGIDIIVGLLHGVSGIIIFFLFFFSIHPTVGSNWLVIVFNPIPLLCLPFSVMRTIRKQKDYYHNLNLLILLCFLAGMTFMPQSFNACMYPILLTFCLRSVSHLLWQHQTLALVHKLPTNNNIKKK